MKSTRLALCLLALSAASAVHAGTMIQAAPDKKEIAPVAAPIPLGTLTIGGLFSEHGTGAYIDTITGLWSTPSRDTALLLDSRYHYEDDNEFISSTGLAFRKKLPDRNVILGVNAFYDSIDSEHDHHFNQLGLGAEVLTHYIDFRFNYYLPENGNKAFDRTDNSFGRFDRFESGLEGLNTELGFLIPGLDKYTEVRVYGGYYHYNNPFGRHDEQGFKGRVEAHLLAGVIAGVEYWNTARLMEGHWTGTVRVTVPFSLFNILKGRSPFEGFADAFKVRPRDFDERIGEEIIRSPRVQTISSGPRLTHARSSGSGSPSLLANAPAGIPFE